MLLDVSMVSRIGPESPQAKNTDTEQLAAGGIEPLGAGDRAAGGTWSRGSGRQPDLEAARILAVLAIFAVHFGFGPYPSLWDALVGRFATRLDLGESGVAAFLAVSGATLCLAYAKAPHEWMPVAKRRLLKLMTPYWFVAVPVLLTFLLVGRLGTDSMRIVESPRFR